MSSIDGALPTISVRLTRTIERSWKKVITIAQNQVDESTQETTRRVSIGRRRVNNPFQEARQTQQPPRPVGAEEEGFRLPSLSQYDRERQMVQSLETLFGLACDSSGYIAFISTMVNSLSPESPVSLAFLSHIIDRASLHSKSTMFLVSPVIISQLKPPRRIHHYMMTLISGYDRSSSLVTDSNTDQEPTSPLPSRWRKANRTSTRSDSAKGKSANTTSKLNATIIWSLLAEKFAGDMCLSIWKEEVGELLFQLLADPEEDLKVRLFTLLALEKFAITGGIKKAILNHKADVCSILLSVIRECEDACQHIYEKSLYEVDSNFTRKIGSETAHLPLSPGPSPSSKNAPNNADKLTRTLKQCLSTFSGARVNLTKFFVGNPHSKKDGPSSESINTALRDDDYCLRDDDNPNRPPEEVGSFLRPQTPNDIYKKDASKPILKDTFSSPYPVPSSQGSKLAKMARESESSKANKPLFSATYCFDRGSIPPEGPLRESWIKYSQLAHCARWSFDNIFASALDESERKVLPAMCSWNISTLNIMMNPFDCTPHLKIGGNCLEIRNDRPNFESVRGTASVKTGKWYYETLLLSGGIMQIGWATKNCRFSPEEGHGVGDDCNGFAFDTYRTAVWANGSAVYPPTRKKRRCKAGDVVGSFLDLDNGLCSFFINGRDIGLTIEFERPNWPTDTDSPVTSNNVLVDLPQNNSVSLNSGRPCKSRAFRSLSELKTSSPQPKTVKCLGLYPAISMTTHQHALLNFGDRPWMFPPPLRTKFKGMNDSGRPDKAFRRRVNGYIKRNQGALMSRSLYRPPTPDLQQKSGGLNRCLPENISSSSLSSSDLDNENIENQESEDDWDGPLCTICFSEPKNILFMPCRHGGVGKECAKFLEIW
ncbi:hypothetical protein CLU79DRAFT_837236 [Phycomyces nitens]|nr:hypothetical protein CLU79DRAFT_837236 [Phycomyces nitens]